MTMIGMPIMPISGNLVTAAEIHVGRFEALKFRRCGQSEEIDALRIVQRRQPGMQRLLLVGIGGSMQFSKKRSGTIVRNDFGIRHRDQSGFLGSHAACPLGRGF